MSFWYLATPYSKYPDGLQAAWDMACCAAADLIRAGIKVYSPIAHTHPIALAGKMDPLDHNIWLPADQPMMDAACGLIVYRAASWEISKGIAHEISAFERAGKPVIYLDPGKSLTMREIVERADKIMRVDEREKP